MDTKSNQMVGYHVYHHKFIIHILITSTLEESHDFKMRIYGVIILCKHLKVSKVVYFTSMNDGPIWHANLTQSVRNDTNFVKYE